MMIKYLGVGLCGALIACGGEDPVDIGEGKTGERLSDYAAVWEGYAEAFAFLDGSDRVRLVLDENGQGTIEFGDSPPPLVASDPEVWPGPVIPYFDPLGGVKYAIHDARAERKRLRIGLDMYEPYRPWCELQTPILDTLNSTATEQKYQCVPRGGWGMSGDACILPDPETQEWDTIDCGKLAMCHRVCECSESGCTAPASPEQVLDGALEDGGDLLVGTLIVDARDYEEVPPVTVRLERQ